MNVINMQERINGHRVKMLTSQNVKRKPLMSSLSPRQTNAGAVKEVSSFFVRTKDMV